MKDTFSDIMNQIKTVIFIYLMIIILHILSSESNLGNVLIATMVSFLMVVISIVLKNLIKRPNLPGFAWATLVSFFLTLPISPLQGIIVESMEQIGRASCRERV